MNAALAAAASSLYYFDMTQTSGAALVGMQAPDFKLQDQNEEWVSLSEAVRSKPLVVAFYPDDFSPVCTKQLCGYQEAYDRFVEYGLDIVGISPNPPEEHQKFKSQYRFAFNLLSDPDKSVFKRYGVTSLFMLGGTSRAVFVVGKGGKILYRYVEPTTLSHRKPGELLAILDGLRKKSLI